MQFNYQTYLLQFFRSLFKTCIALLGVDESCTFVHFVLLYYSLRLNIHCSTLQTLERILTQGSIVHIYEYFSFLVLGEGDINIYISVGK